jgi:hypothetical protein
MRKPFLLLLAGLSLPALLGGIAAAGCGSTIVETNPDETDGGTPDAKHDAKHDGDVIDSSSDAKDALPDYVDPGCPDAGPPITAYACDPYQQFNGDCPPGQGCYIYVQYPEEPCGQEVYGAACADTGPGQQGDPCGGGQDCGGGYVCVVSGSGNQCVKLCNLKGEDGCPAGLVCEPIDVEGFGGCL